MTQKMLKAQRKRLCEVVEELQQANQACDIARYDAALVQVATLSRNILEAEGELMRQQSVSREVRGD